MPRGNLYKKIVPYIKDAVYVIGILISLAGWIRSESRNKTIQETTIKNNTEALKKVEVFMEKQVDINSKQAEINGAMLEFKNSHQHD